VPKRRAFLCVLALFLTTTLFSGFVQGAAAASLLGQYGTWGAYKDSSDGKKVCFVLAKPTKSENDPPNRNSVFMFITTRPADKVTNEISLTIGYPFKAGSEATAQIASTNFALYTQKDGAWIKNAAEEPRMITGMRVPGAESVVIKGVSAKGTQSIDTFSLRGFDRALDLADQECLKNFKPQEIAENHGQQITTASTAVNRQGGGDVPLGGEQVDPAAAALTAATQASRAGTNAPEAETPPPFDPSKPYADYTPPTPAAAPPR
jgi:hypothetical protein